VKRSAALTWHRLRWPREVTPEQLLAAFRLLASGGGAPLVVEAVGMAGQVAHRLALPAGHAESVTDQLRAALPGLAVEALPARPPLAVRHAVALRLSTQRRALRSEDVLQSSRALLTALAQVHTQECVVLQWVLMRPLPAMAVPNRLALLDQESWLGALLAAPFSPPQPLDAEVRQALRTKQSQPGWRAVARVGVSSGNGARERQLVAQLLGALRTVEAPGVRFGARTANPARVKQATAGWRAGLRLNIGELAAVSAWPVGLTTELPVDQLSARLLPATTAIARQGLVIGRASYPGQERPLALTPTDALRHIHLLGPSGVGKSTVLLHLITQSIAAGRSVVVLEPKGDLIADTLARISPQRVRDVVLIDPSDPGERVVGINPLASAGRPPELVADQLLGLWHALYAASWGPRTADILGAALLSLARTPNMTIAALPALLTNAPFRRRLTAKVSDPIGLGPFWASFEQWSEPERAKAIAPVMNKLRPFLMRPELRHLLGHAQGFDVRRVFTEKKILLVNLSKGLLGPESSALLGSLIVSLLWQAILGRAAIASERRQPALIVVDEFQEYLHLGTTDFADALAQARGLGAGFALAHQYLRQCSPAIRSALLANAQSRVAFRLPSEDARGLAADSQLAPGDFQGLGAFQAYAQLVAGGAVQPWCSLDTLPAPEPISDAAAVRAASSATYGVERATVEAELRALFAGERSPTDDLTPRRRSIPGGKQ
jgi:Type IV secretion-system coupling protein DNA-binding domain